MSEIRKWLEAIGLGQYADAFEANEIGPTPSNHSRFVKLTAKFGIWSAKRRCTTS
jgi:hypothetical protein